MNKLKSEHEIKLIRFRTQDPLECYCIFTGIRTHDFQNEIEQAKLVIQLLNCNLIIHLLADFNDILLGMGFEPRTLQKMMFITTGIQTHDFRSKIR